MGDPETAAFVEADVSGLGDLWFVEEIVDGEAGGGFEESEGVGRVDEEPAFRRGAGLHDGGGGVEVGGGVEIGGLVGVARGGVSGGRFGAGDFPWVVELDLVEIAGDDGRGGEVVRFGGSVEADDEGIGAGLLEGVARDFEAGGLIRARGGGIEEDLAVEGDGKGSGHGRECERHGVAPERVAIGIGHVVGDDDP